MSNKVALEDINLILALFGPGSELHTEVIEEGAQMYVDSNQSFEYQEGMIKGLLTALEFINHTEDKEETLLGLGAICYQCIEHSKYSINA